MIRGMYVATSGMQTQMKRMDVVSNNLANIDTKGYKSDNLLSRSFGEILNEKLKDPNIVNVRTLETGAGVHIDEVHTLFKQGPLEQTNRSCDLSILGEGFFVVDTPQGERYTRAGNFTLDALGYLTTNEGYRVLSENGHVFVGNDKFTVSADGTLTAQGATHKLRVVTFDNNQTLRKQGSNLFYSIGGQPYDATNFQIKQGYLENSNVDLTTQIIEMINISRNFETNQRVVRMMDETLGKAVNEIGRV